MHDITSLEQYNQQLTEQTHRKRDEIATTRQHHGYTGKDQYAFFQLTKTIQALLDQFLAETYPDITPAPFQIHRIDASMFGADLTIKFDPRIVRTLGKQFASECVPQAIAWLNDKKDTLPFTHIEQKAIYINCAIDPVFFGTIAKEIHSLGDRYGDLDLYAGQTAIAEYSSPNAAKHLHAGHVRSTVIGYVLSNIYEHAGYTVHRVNHINDRGGFGQLIEGRKRWHDILYAKGLRNNDLNYQIYTIFRQAELCVKQRDESLSEWLQEYFPHTTPDELNTQFEIFQKAATQTFLALEAGDPDAFSIWQKIVASSLVEFKEFYDKLDIGHDYTIGESFYEKIGRQCIEEGEKTGLIVTFTEELADDHFHKFQLAHPDLEQVVRQKKHEEIHADIGAKVVLLDNRERFVVLRSDGGSIYATRDLGCLWFRTQTRAPSLIMYEVGQEQEDHFQKLFETADKLGRLDRDDGTKTQCLHIAHGFYVDASTKKKLSSRAGASNVHALIDASIEYFSKKYDTTTDFTPEEIAHNARTLGIASIIINDLSKNRMDPVLVDPDLTTTIQGFEQSGGAYLIYTICRAKSLLRKATVSRQDGGGKDYTSHQIALVKHLSELPISLEKAVMQHEPSLLVNYAYQLTQTYNSMYGTTDRMIDDAGALYLTACYIQIMTNILRICNIEPLERI